MEAPPARLVGNALPAIGEETKRIRSMAAQAAPPLQQQQQSHRIFHTASFSTLPQQHHAKRQQEEEEDIEDDQDDETTDEEVPTARSGGIYSGGYHGTNDASASAGGRRRRFHSTDVVLRHTPSAPSSFTHAYYDRGGFTSGGIAAARAREIPAQPPAQFIRHRQRRRAQSSDFAFSSSSAASSKMARNYTSGHSWRSLEKQQPPLGDLQNAILEEIYHEEPNDNQEEDDDASELEEGDDSGSDRDSGSGHYSDGEADEALTNHSKTTRSRRTGSDDSNGSSSMMSHNSYQHGARSYESTESVEKLLNLQKLYQEGFITVTEYKDRRLQLVDELTVTDQTIHRATDLIQVNLPVVHRDPPDFTILRERDAIKHVFDSEKRKWTSCRIKVKIDSHPFGRGGLRQVFHLQDLSVIPRLGSEGRPVSYVAKIAIDVNENPDTYFRDVEMQAVASKFAKLYNSYFPPRRVEFLDAWILQLVPSGTSDDGNVTMRGTICGVEPYIAGEYLKHNNNFGYVSELDRNTPQAFSHFTYEASGRQMLIVDIQGVADHYTDPQIHTRSGKEFGKGNMAVQGFERFLASHRCNPICRYLKLPLNNPKDEFPTNGGRRGSGAGGAGGGAGGNGGANGSHSGNTDGKGTVPAQTYMSQPRIRVKKVDSELCHYYGDSTAFKKYQAKHQQEMKNSSSRAKKDHKQIGGGDSQEDSATSAFVMALKQQRNCSSFCGIGACTIS